MYDQPLHSGPAEVTLAGGLSPYGTMAQNGNLSEWEETSFNLRNDLTNTSRGLRGISWTNDDVEDMARSSRYGSRAGFRGRGIGFRVASIYEPSSLPSDLTGNGFVDFKDLTVLLANWNKDVTAADGNLVEPATTVVNFEDLTVLLADWTGPGPAGSPEAALGSEAVPEPSTFVLALLAMLGLSFFRRRRQRA